MGSGLRNIALGGLAASVAAAAAALVATSWLPTGTATGSIIAIALASALACNLCWTFWCLNLKRRLIAREEAETDAILEAVADGIAVMDPRGTVESLNGAAERMFGFGREEIEGKFFTALIEPEPDQTLEGLLEAHLAAQPGIGREIRARRKDGTTFPLELAINELQVHGKRKLTAVLRDVTVRKHVQRALSDARDAALASTQARSAFLANVSHEIRTPMNIILGMSEMVEDAGDLNEDQTEFLGRVTAAARNLLVLLDDTLDLSKIEAGMMTILEEEMNLRDVIEEVHGLVVVRTQEKGLALDIEFDDRIPHTVRGDAGRIRQILMNLAGNAAKFTHDGSITIVARQISRSDTESSIRLAVRDTGIGIPKDRQAAIFETYQQASASSHKEYGGTGLGLAICKQLSRLMSGEIGLDSVEGEGSEFWVELPFPVAASEPEAPREDASAIDAPTGV